MVLAAAGRRIDAAGQPQARFPLSQVPAVQQKLRGLLIEQKVRILVCSAACGADLVALEEAGTLGIERHIVLPFEPERFRISSVIDRPGNWGEAFDRALAEVKNNGRLTVVPACENEQTAYAAANRAILETARGLALRTGDRAAAVLLWDGRSRGAGDLTAEFGSEAQRMGFPRFDLDTSRDFDLNHPH